MIFGRHMFTTLWHVVTQSPVRTSTSSRPDSPLTSGQHRESRGVPINHLIPHRNLMEDDYLIGLLESSGKRVRNKLRHSFGKLKFLRIMFISLVVQSLSPCPDPGTWLVPNVHGCESFLADRLFCFVDLYRISLTSVCPYFRTIIARLFHPLVDRHDFSIHYM